MPRRVPDPSPEARIAAGKARMLARIPTGGTGCWEWPGGTVANGYGALNVRLGTLGEPKVMLYAHRVAYEHFVGPIADGQVIDHLCRNPRCCRPDHLEAVSHRENIVRGKGKAPDVPCPQGHVGNFRQKAGGRVCRDCARARSREWKRRGRAKA